MISRERKFAALVLVFLDLYFIGRSYWVATIVTSITIAFLIINWRNGPFKAYISDDVWEWISAIVFIGIILVLLTLAYSGHSNITP